MHNACTYRCTRTDILRLRQTTKDWIEWKNWAVWFCAKHPEPLILQMNLRGCTILVQQLYTMIQKYHKWFSVPDLLTLWDYKWQHFFFYCNNDAEGAMNGDDLGDGTLAVFHFYTYLLFIPTLACILRLIFVRRYSSWSKDTKLIASLLWSTLNGGCID